MRAGHAVPWASAVRTWAAVGWQTFGGPAGQIAVMQRILVEEKRWVGQRRFTHALSYCMVLPGPEAQQLAIYLGWLLNGVAGGVLAGTLFVLPGAVTLLALSAVYVAYGDTPLLVGLFAGLAPAVVVIVVQALARVAHRGLTGVVFQGIALAAFVALAIFAVPFPVVIAVAAFTGWTVGRSGAAAIAHHQETTGGLTPVIADDALHAPNPTMRRSVRIVGFGALAWAVPLGGVAWLTGASSTLTDMGLFFSGTAVVTFGGAYAVLAYVTQRAVEVYGWLTPGEMVRGLALAESTPGPLIMVVQFVAFVGAYRNPGSLDPWLAAFVAALLTTWVTFVPGFIFVLLGAPSVERLRGNTSVSSALAGVTAAVVGVIANVALFFAVHTFFAKTEPDKTGLGRIEVPDVSSIRPEAIVIALIAAWLVHRGWSLLRVLLISAALGLGLSLVSLS
ncbi:MAG: chromate efflux transporter [Actinomycetota bacterium]